MRIVRRALDLLALILVVVSLLPIVETNVWFVRMLDFPRAQFLAAIALVVLLMLWLARRRSLAFYALMIGLAGAGLYHIVKLAPVTVGATLKADLACPRGAFSVLIANVQRGNRQAGGLIETVRRAAPDVFIAQETDEWWDGQLAALADLYPHTASAITGSFYGMHLFSRHPLASSEVLHPTDRDTPVIRASVALPAGPVTVLGVHPRPPQTGQSTVPRDGELLWTALGIDRTTPVVVAGDLNAVPWERTVERMRRLGGLLDPRHRAGFMATFDAHSSWMKWPLDHILHTGALTAVRTEVLPAFGSDHHPYLAELCPAATLDAIPEPRPGDREEAERTIARARAL